jgi:hypothetical protein
MKGEWNWFRIILNLRVPTADSRNVVTEYSALSTLYDLEVYYEHCIPNYLYRYYNSNGLYRHSTWKGK